MVSSLLSQSEIKYTSKIVDSLNVIGSVDKKVLEAKRQAHLGAVIGTHSDTFHCDEVLACTMLLYTQKYANPVIVRTRDQEVLNTLDILVDVGAEYIPEKLRFDHHQKSFTDTWDSSNEKYKGIRLSSAGLIYKHFGREVIKNATKSIWNMELTDQQLEQTYKLLYKKLILEVDAIDNGVSEAKDMRYMI